jgi:large subunit ribosomal protein L6
MTTPLQTTIPLPPTVAISRQGGQLRITGPLGTSTLLLRSLDPRGGCALALAPGELRLVSMSRAHHGLLARLLRNRVEGVTRGFLVYLKLVGIGYRVALQGHTLTLRVGYSHDLLYRLPASMRVFLVDPTLLCLFGIDRHQVSQVAAALRRLRPPSPYQGKGIRRLEESVALRTGKRK